MEQGSTETPVKEAQIPQADVAGIYDRLAWIYDVWASLTESKARARALALADIEDGAQVLEVAAGTGLAFAELVRCNPSGRNVGIDLSPGMLRKAQERLRHNALSNFELSVGSAFDIKEPDASFDVLLNNYMFDLMARDDWPRALGASRRVLKPGGRPVLSGMTPGEGHGAGRRGERRAGGPGGHGRGVRASAPTGPGGRASRHRPDCWGLAGRVARVESRPDRPTADSARSRRPWPRGA